MKPLVPVKETRTPPPYPSVAQMTNEEGVTLLEVTIGTEGTVTSAKVVTSSGSLRLDESALEHVKAQWRWEPPQKDCQPAEAVTRVSIVWNLKESPDENPPGVVKWAPPQSDYPPEALVRREQGLVGLILRLSDTGEVFDAKTAVSSGFPILDDKALQLAKARKWSPAQMDGKPVATIIQLAVIWGLPDAGGNK